MWKPQNFKQIGSFSRQELSEFLSKNAASLLEEEALAVLANPFVTPGMCQAIAVTRHLVGFRAVRLRLVQTRATPLTHSIKLIHYLSWTDLLRLSVEVTVPAQVRRAIDTQLLLRLDTISLGEKISAAKR
ncbi:MAG: hypothetical protein ACRD3J_09225, partial [Thermoanaerobaculia bacterium]